MITETINSQELYCHLDDYAFKNPLEDQWESFKRAIKVWCDCWFGQEPKFELRGDDWLYVRLEGISVQIDGDGYGIICMFKYHPEGWQDNNPDNDMPENKFEILFFDEDNGRWDGDHYPLTVK